VFYMARAVWPMFRRQQEGVMVNISSMAARDPFAGLGAYGAAKAGVNVLSLALAREGAAMGVRVHTIAPGATETAMFRSIRTVEQYPAEKTMRPEEVARVICQCIAGDLRYTSGEVIYLNKTSE
jgi:NAD(P)-dependent dehydrogenase (short-subunit alcohol dehydrogenase family)